MIPAANKPPQIDGLQAFQFHSLAFPFSPASGLFSLAKKFIGADDVFAGIIAPTVAADKSVSDHAPAMVAFDQFRTLNYYGFHELREPLATARFQFAEFLHNSKG